jgi:FHS family Na+ dependent glucose MFS transporter 1
MLFSDSGNDRTTTSAGAVPGYLVAFVFMGLVITMSGPALSHLRDRMHTNDGGVAWVFVGQSTGYIIGTILGGRAFDGGRGHRWWSIAIVTSVVAVLGVSAAPNMAVLVVSFAVVGGCCGVADVGGNTLVMWSRPEGPGALLNALHLCFAIGAVTAPIIVNRSLHWAHSLWGVAVPGAVLAAIAVSMLWTRPSPRHTRAETLERSTAGGARRLHVALVALFFFGYVALEGGFAGWIHTYVEQIHYGDAATATGVVTAFWAGFTFGRVVSIWIARRFTPGSMVAVSMCITVAASVLFAVFRGGGPMLWVVTFLFAVSIAPQYASMMAFAEAHLALSGRNTSVLIGASGIGGLFLPWLLGQLFDHIGPQALPPVMVATSVLTSLLALLAGRVILAAHRPPAASIALPVT